MKSTQKAFTLVELIVVITILAILGTIAFISLQGYSADARNSKRTSDLNTISNSINTKNTEWASLMSFILDNSAKLTVTSNFGWTWSTNSDYKAGNLNYNALGIKEADFKDPNDIPYKAGVTTTANGRFEIAATIEDDANKKAKIVGTYNNPRPAQGITLAATWSTYAVLKDGDINKIFRNDYVTDWTTTSKVTKVSADGKTITIGNQPALLSNFGLVLAEEGGLIESVTAWTPVTNNHATNVPY